MVVTDHGPFTVIGDQDGFEVVLLGGAVVLDAIRIPEPA